MLVAYYDGGDPNPPGRSQPDGAARHSEAPTTASNATLERFSQGYIKTKTKQNIPSEERPVVRVLLNYEFSLWDLAVITNNRY